jgi:hypothetical protein
MAELEAILMWRCANCGCMEIAPDLQICPQCHVPRDVPAAPVEEPPISNTEPQVPSKGGKDAKS